MGYYAKKLLTNPNEFSSVFSLSNTDIDVKI